MTEQFRVAFDNAVLELEEKKDHSSSHMTENKYKYVLKRLNEIASGSKMKGGKDYRLLKTYYKKSAIIQGILVEQLCKPGTDLLYLSHSQLYDAIRDEHLSTVHGGRYIMHQFTNGPNCNASRSSSKFFVGMWSSLREMQL